MKKNKILFLLISIFLCFGCSNLKIKINEFENMLDSKFEHMLKISENELTEIYDIDLTKFKDYTFKMSYNDPTNIYVLVLPSTSNNEAKKEVNKFFDHLEKNSNEVTKKRIKTRYSKKLGDYLVFLVSDENEKIYQEIKETLENKTDN
ncbi:MAG: DUF4358 domain-containing protein [Bacilli bacterium]|nr:DUF4358 domain-containing protein [Bacilli bacterium]